MGPFQDHYRTLGVHRHAEQTVIEAAYRALARLYHPDVNTAAASSIERLKDVNAAYAVLSDPAKRRVYDRDWDAANTPKQASQAGRTSGPRPSPPSASNSQPPPKPSPPSPTPEVAVRKKLPLLVRLAGWAVGLLVIRSVISSMATTTNPQVVRPTSTATSAVIATQPTAALGIAIGSALTQAVGAPRWGFDQVFGPQLDIKTHDTDLSTSQLGEGGLTLTIKAPGGLDGYVFDEIPSGGRDFAYRIDIRSTDGWGEVTLTLDSMAAILSGPLPIDPRAQEWSLIGPVPPRQNCSIGSSHDHMQLLLLDPLRRSKLSSPIMFPCSGSTAWMS